MNLFIFGSTGDLVKRKVLPALQNLNEERLEIWAIGRRAFTNDLYRNFICQDRCTRLFRNKIHYLKIDFKTDICLNCNSIFDKKEINRFYLSLPPNILDKIILSLAALKKRGYRVKILIEKPFGENYHHAQKLKRLIEKNELKKDVFLADHYLFKKNVQKLKKTNFKKLEIVSLEKLGLENRGAYYNRIGALKDMVQSHFFNILFKLMSPARLELYRVFKYYRGQYDSYEKELGEKSGTETFVKLILKRGNKEILLVTGKKFDKKESYISIDGKKIEIGAENPYGNLFTNFFEGKRRFFAKIDESVLSWRIIEKLDKNKPKLIKYKDGLSSEDIGKVFG